MKFTVPAPNILLVLLLTAIEAPTLASARALALAAPSDSRALTQNEHFIPQQQAETKRDPLVSRNLIDKIKEAVDKTVDTMTGNGGGGGPGQDTAGGGGGGGESPGQQDGRDSSRLRLRQVELDVTSTTTTTAGVPEATDAGAAKPVLVIKPIEDEGGEEPLVPEGGEVAV